MDSAQSIRKFFHYMGLVAILSAYNTNLSGLSLFEMANLSFRNFIFNMMMGIPGGFSWMFGTDLYLYFKKSISK